MSTIEKDKMKNLLKLHTMGPKLEEEEGENADKIRKKN
jgi:hypothetical protein